LEKYKFTKNVSSRRFSRRQNHYWRMRIFTLLNQFLMNILSLLQTPVTYMSLNSRFLESNITAKLPSECLCSWPSENCSVAPFEKP